MSNQIYKPDENEVLFCNASRPVKINDQLIGIGDLFVTNSNIVWVGNNCEKVLIKNIRQEDDRSDEVGGPSGNFREGTGPSSSAQNLPHSPRDEAAGPSQPNQGERLLDRNNSWELIDAQVDSHEFVEDVKYVVATAEQSRERYMVAEIPNYVEEAVNQLPFIVVPEEEVQQIPEEVVEEDQVEEDDHAAEDGGHAGIGVIEIVDAEWNLVNWLFFDDGFNVFDEEGWWMHEIPNEIAPAA